MRCVADQERQHWPEAQCLIDEVPKSGAKRVHTFLVTEPHGLIERDRYCLRLLQGIGMGEDLIDGPCSCSNDCRSACSE